MMTFGLDLINLNRFPPIPEGRCAWPCKQHPDLCGAAHSGPTSGQIGRNKARRSIVWGFLRLGLTITPQSRRSAVKGITGGRAGARPKPHHETGGIWYRLHYGKRQEYPPNTNFKRPHGTEPLSGI